MVSVEVKGGAVLEEDVVETEPGTQGWWGWIPRASEKAPSRIYSAFSSGTELTIMICD